MIVGRSSDWFDGLSGATPGKRFHYHRTARDLPCVTAQLRSRLTSLVETPRLFSMSTRLRVVHNLSAAFLAGEWTLAGLVQRGGLACGKRERWIRALARRVLKEFPDFDVERSAELARFINGDKGFLRAWTNNSQRGHVPLRQLFWSNPVMRRAAGVPASWELPALTTPGALAAWLGLDPPHLDWFADCRGREAYARHEPLRHYTYQWRAKPSGRARLLEKPKQRLRAIQRRILHEILDRVPPHEAVHGYRRGRSIVTAVAPHSGRRIVLHFDLRDFFPSVRRSRVHALFAALGYPAPVARLLTGLCTNVVPEDIWRVAPESMRHLLRSPHLPQGVPTSPALANLCANSLDRRLAALARAVGANYTRYADDLTFSGDHDLERSARRFQVQVCILALEEGFEVQTRKSRFMRQGVRQQVGGIVLNQHPNLARNEYDRLKAVLFNCIRFGPDSQNREQHGDFRAHLGGRVAYAAFINPARGQRLRSLFERITWAE